MQIGTNYWPVSWGSGAADPFVNGYTNVTGSDPWRPEFLAETEFYKVHRFMDWNRTNDSPQRTWSDRPQQGDSNQRTVAYEWMIDICNRHGADAWVTVPHLTFESQDYWTQLAELFMEQLRDDLRLYIEYSNETWNFIFDQAEYCRAQGVALNLDSAEYTAGFKFHVYAAVRMFERFNAVWGADSTRLVRVLAGQSVNTWMTGKHIEALGDSQINPNGVQADVYSIAPYFGNGASTIEEAGAAVPGAIQHAANQAAAVEGSGLQLNAYEGGQHLMGNADVVSRNPRMYDHYTTYLQGIAPHIGVFAHYNHSSSYSSGGAWGAKEGIGQAISQAHKYRSLVDYAGEAPDKETLVSFDDLWKFSLYAPGDGWTTLDFDDAEWEMQEGDDESAVYLRRGFTSSLQSVDGLQLTVRHDMGFVAYINGTEVLNVAAGSTQEVYRIDQHSHLINRGNNVLAVRLHTDEFDSTDLSINPELKAYGEE